MGGWAVVPVYADIGQPECQCRNSKPENARKNVKILNNNNADTKGGNGDSQVDKAAEHRNWPAFWETDFCHMCFTPRIWSVLPNMFNKAGGMVKTDPYKARLA